MSTYHFMLPTIMSSTWQKISGFPTFKILPEKVHKNTYYIMTDFSSRDARNNNNNLDNNNIIVLPFTTTSFVRQFQLHTINFELAICLSIARTCLQPLPFFLSLPQKSIYENLSVTVNSSFIPLLHTTMQSRPASFIPALTKVRAELSISVLIWFWFSCLFTRYKWPLALNKFKADKDGQQSNQASYY